MGVPTSEFGCTPAMPFREDHEVHKGHVVALGEKKYYDVLVKSDSETERSGWLTALFSRVHDQFLLHSSRWHIYQSLVSLKVDNWHFNKIAYSDKLNPVLSNVMNRWTAEVFTSEQF